MTESASTIEQHVLGLVHELAAAMAARDVAGLRNVCSPMGWAVHLRGGRTSHERLWDLAERVPAGPTKLEERIWGATVHVDEDIAVVWCSYNVYFDDEPHHWGTNIVSFINEHGRWLVSGITDNGRSGPRPHDSDERRN